MGRLVAGNRWVMVLAALGVAGLQAAETPRSQWKLGEFTWVKRAAAEAGAPANAHPATVGIEGLRKQLGAITLTSEGAVEPLFAPDEVAVFLGSLREALSVVGPGEDLLLLSTHRREGGFLNTPLGLTARFFVQDGALNVIVHDARMDFVDRYMGRQVMPAFQYGSRSAAGTVVLKCPGATQPRPDWLRIPMARLQQAAAAPAAFEPAPASEAPVVAPSGRTRDAAFFEAQQNRLRGLKRMREENLITEEEYQQKRKEILESL